MNFNDVIKSNDYLILDTETTGLHDGEIVQIAIIDAAGCTLLDTCVKPVLGIPADASRIHGITLETVANAPRWAAVSQQVLEIVRGRHVVVYNAVYDRKMMHQSGEKAGIAKIDWKQLATFWCAMEAYARFYGDWNSYRRSYTWQSLTNACRQQSIEVANAHSALGDCLMTLAVCRKMVSDE